MQSASGTPAAQGSPRSRFCFKKPDENSAEAGKASRRAASAPSAAEAALADISNGSEGSPSAAVRPASEVLSEVSSRKTHPMAPIREHPSPDFNGKTAEGARELGNTYFKQGHYAPAVEAYTRSDAGLDTTAATPASAAQPELSSATCSIIPRCTCSLPLFKCSSVAIPCL